MKHIAEQCNTVQQLQMFPSKNHLLSLQLLAIEAILLWWLP